MYKYVCIGNRAQNVKRAFCKPNGINNAVGTFQCTCIMPTVNGMQLNSNFCVDSIFNLRQTGKRAKCECRLAEQMANKKPYTTSHSLHTHNYLMLNYIQMKLAPRDAHGAKSGDRGRTRIGMVQVWPMWKKSPLNCINCINCMNCICLYRWITYRFLV